MWTQEQLVDGELSDVWRGRRSQSLSLGRKPRQPQPGTPPAPASFTDPLAPSDDPVGLRLAQIRPGSVLRLGLRACRAMVCVQCLLFTVVWFAEWYGVLPW